MHEEAANEGTRQSARGEQGGEEGGRVTGKMSGQEDGLERQKSEDELHRATTQQDGRVQVRLREHLLKPVPEVALQTKSYAYV